MNEVECVTRLGISKSHFYFSSLLGEKNKFDD